MELADLHKPFPPNEIEWRVGSTTQDKKKGMALAYLTARHIMDRLDAVCGSANWQDRYEFHGARTICYLSIRVGDEWVTKADGAGDSDVEAEKGAISDALKRAAVKWGIGRYLYATESVWVEIEPAGKSFKIKQGEYAKLARSLGGTAPAPQRQPEPAPKPSDDEARAAYDELAIAINAAPTLAELAEIWTKNQTAIKQLPGDWRDKLQEFKTDRKADLTPQPGAVNPTAQFDRMASEQAA